MAVSTSVYADASVPERAGQCWGQETAVRYSVRFRGETEEYRGLLEARPEYTCLSVLARDQGSAQSAYG